MMCQRILTLEPDCTEPVLFVFFGNALFNLKRYGEARNCYEKAIECNDRHHSIDYNSHMLHQLYHLQGLTYMFDKSLNYSEEERIKLVLKYLKKALEYYRVPRVEALVLDFERRLREKKASPEGKDKNGCFIATAVYGSPMAREVGLLREYRDNVLTRSRHGRAFIWAYFQVGPTGT